MKKIFTLLTAAIMSAAAFAQTEPVVYTFGENNCNYVVNEFGSKGTYNERPSVSYTKVSEKLAVSLESVPNVRFEYSNTGGTKADVVKTGESYIQFDSKNFVIIVEGLKAGEKVYVEYEAKGSTNAKMTNAGNTNSLDIEGSVDSSAKGEKAIFGVEAASNGSVKIKETTGGFRLYHLGINTNDFASSISGVKADAKAQTKKVLRNNQVVIETANGTFNANGAQVK